MKAIIKTTTATTSRRNKGGASNWIEWKFDNKKKEKKKTRARATTTRTFTNKSSSLRALYY